MNKFFRDPSYIALCVLLLNLFTQIVYLANGQIEGTKFQWFIGLYRCTSLKFDKEKSVKWSCALPGPSAATPIIFEDMVFIPSIKSIS